MGESRTFVFLNVSSSPTDQRTKAFVKNTALSQAARYCHSRRSWFANSSQQGGGVGVQKQTDFKKRTQSKTLSLTDVLRPEAIEPQLPRKPSKRPLRWRAALRPREVSPPSSKPSACSSSERISSRERLEVDKEVMTLPSIPRHKGNSDPFRCAAIPMTALDYAVMDTSFLAWVSIIWPSEIYLRRNRESLASAFRKSMPSVLDHPATAHGILSEAFSRRAREAKAQGRPSEPAVRESLKHKVQAMRLLRERIETFQKTGGRAVLNDIRCTSAELGVAEIASGNFSAAQMHYAATATALDLLGGSKTVSPVELDCVLLRVVANAWFSRSRPVLLPDRWDPGPRIEAKLKSSKSTATTSGLRPSLPPQHCSVMRPELRCILDQTRELLEMEELKFSLDASESEEAEKLFRWSHRRKLAVRARNLQHWCDLKESIAGLAPSFDMILCLTVRCFDHAIFEEYYLPNKPLLRPSKTLLAELALGLHSLSPPFRDDGYMNADKSLNGLTNTGDRRRFDMLWIYSVGAYVENYLSSVGPRPGPAIQHDWQKDKSLAHSFSMRFSRLAKALDFVIFEELVSFLSEEYLCCVRLQGETLRRLMGS